MVSIARKRQIARENGALGGRPPTKIMLLRKRARLRAMRLLATQQEKSVRVLIDLRDDPNVPPSERIRCAVELLNRGEVPSKSASFHGHGSAEALDEMFGAPKLVVLGQWKTQDEIPEATEAEPPLLPPEGNGGQP